MKRFKNFIIIESLLPHSADNPDSDIYVNPKPSEVNEIFKGMSSSEYCRGIISKNFDLFIWPGRENLSHAQGSELLQDIIEDNDDDALPVKVNFKDVDVKFELGNNGSPVPPLAVSIKKNLDMYLAESYGDKINNATIALSAMNKCKSNNKWIRNVRSQVVSL